MRLIPMRANRANGRRCTCPRSPEGKKRVAQNALRHGLARAIAADEPWSKPVRLLMDAIVGGDRDEERLCLARAIAEPAMEVMRVRRARQALLDVALRTQRFGPDAFKVLGPRKYLRLVARKLRQGDSIESDPELNPAPLSEQENRAAAIAEVASKLFALDRYERRACQGANSRSEIGTITRRDEKETRPIAPSIRRRRRSTRMPYEANRMAARPPSDRRANRAAALVRRICRRSGAKR